MTTRPTKLRLSGPGLRGARVSGPLLRDLLDLVVDATRAAVRLRLEGRSTAQGPAPSWVEHAAAFEVISIEEGSTLVSLEAVPVAEAAPEQFAQVELFGGVDGRRSCLDLMADSLDDAVSARAESDLYDDDLLRTFGRFERLFRHGVDLVEVANGRTIRLDRPALTTFETLKKNTPPDQRVVVAGKLDAIRHSDRMFTLVLDDGNAVRGLLANTVDLDLIGNLWGRQVKLSGVAKFRPSGSVLRVEADALEEPAGDASLWAAMPRPMFTELDTRSLRRPQGSRSGVAAIFGKWPGEESDDEFLRAIAELS